MSKRKSDSSSPLNNNKRRATHQPDFELFCQPSAACQTLLPTFTDDLNEARYEKVISDASRGFDDLISNLLRVLDLRALAHGQALQVDKGLQDAHLMISLAPLKASGYLRAGALYSQRSQQAEAMRIYEQGLEVVPQEEQPLLEERYASAKALRNRRVDFLEALPFDLATIILFSLPRESLYQALDVSTTWRHRVSQYPRLWNRLTLTQQKDIAYLPIVGQHVQILQLSYLNHGQCEQIFDMVISSGICKKLDFLHLAFSRINDYGRCLMVLSQVKNTLTKLEIVLPKGSPMFPLAVVLSACSNLKQLYYKHHTAAATTESFGTLSSASMCPSLLDLELSFKSLSTVALRKILSCCLNVRKLSIDYCDATAISAIRDCCPALVAFGYNRSVPIDEQQKKAVFSTVSTGIRHIASRAVKGLDYGGLLRLISKNTKTLETLAFRFPRSAFEEVWYQLTDDSAYSNLRQLEVDFCDHFNPKYEELILRCPSLERLSILNAVYIGAEVFQAISRLSYLQLLHISGVVGVHEEAMVFMFQAIAAYSSLHTLRLGECTFDMTAGILQAIANTQSLKVLELIDLFAKRTAFTTFVKALRNSSVHSITLDFLNCVSDEAIRYINCIQSLKRLQLYNLENVTHDGLLCVSNNPKISLLVQIFKL